MGWPFGIAGHHAGDRKRFLPKEEMRMEAQTRRAMPEQEALDDSVTHARKSRVALALGAGFAMALCGSARFVFFARVQCHRGVTHVLYSTSD
jgi:hypothetical protein